VAGIDFSRLSASIAHLGRDHNVPPLDESQMDPDPLVVFGKWMSEALEAGIDLPNAMTLATADARGVPSARMVLLKSFDEEGFVFFSNYESRKGRELEQNPNAALVFYWSRLERQICVAGPVERLERAQSVEYFASRPLGSRLGTIVSRQSTVLSSRDELEAAVLDAESRYADEDVPLPDYWGGYLLRPERIEFWQSRPNRLHDRFHYTREDSAWRMDRLAP
jgi:pyridoxamine 5'-phosphate oxidase